VSVVFPAGGTIFISDRVQFEARETLSDGATRTAANAVWGSDAPGVASVSPTGLVTAVAAGEATIFADVNPRGTLRIRVFPDFRGTWTGTEVMTSCEESGTFVGVCTELAGLLGAHNSSFVQNQETVDAVIDTGDGTRATMTGMITVGGELQLPSAPVLPADPTVQAQVQNWRSRADVPSRMTGTYEALFTAPGVPGSFTMRLELQNVVKTSAASTSQPGSSTVEGVVRRVRSRLKGP
jgi:hypothetical protein